MSDNERSFMYSVKLNPFEDEYLERQKYGFSDFVHKSFYYAMKKDYLNRYRTIGNFIFYIILGSILLTFTYITINLITWITVFIGGLFCITFGLIGISWEVKKYNAKRRKR